MNDLNVFNRFKLLFAVALRRLIDGILRKQLDSLEATRHFVSL